jgi:flagellar motility protein MotE (MotC chaperone)
VIEEETHSEESRRTTCRYCNMNFVLVGSRRNHEKYNCLKNPDRVARVKNTRNKIKKSKSLWGTIDNLHRNLDDLREEKKKTLQYLNELDEAIKDAEKEIVNEAKRIINREWGGK